MAKFDEYITGKLELEVGGEELLLDFTIADKRKIKTAGGTSGAITEKQLEIIDNCFLDVLKKSYPESTTEALEGFYNKNDIEFLQKFMVKVGWATEEDFEPKENKSPQ